MTLMSLDVICLPKILVANFKTCDPTVGLYKIFLEKDVLPSFVTGTYVRHSHVTVCFSFHFFLVYLCYIIRCINSLYWLLSCVDHPVHSQIMGALEGPSTILTDVVPLI